MQQQELAQMRQRDANLTALAAIGPRKKRKVDSPGATPSGTEVRTILSMFFFLSSPVCNADLLSIFGKLTVENFGFNLI